MPPKAKRGRKAGKPKDASTCGDAGGRGKDGEPCGRWFALIPENGRCKDHQPEGSRWAAEYRPHAEKRKAELKEKKDAASIEAKGGEVKAPGAPKGKGRFLTDWAKRRLALAKAAKAKAKSENKTETKVEVKSSAVANVPASFNSPKATANAVPLFASLYSPSRSLPPPFPSSLSLPPPLSSSSSLSSSLPPRLSSISPSPAAGEVKQLKSSSSTFISPILLGEIPGENKEKSATCVAMGCKNEKRVGAELCEYHFRALTSFGKPYLIAPSAAT